MLKFLFLIASTILTIETSYSRVMECTAVSAGNSMRPGPHEIKFTISDETKSTLGEVKFDQAVGWSESLGVHNFTLIYASNTSGRNIPHVLAGIADKLMDPNLGRTYKYLLEIEFESLFSRTGRLKIGDRIVRELEHSMGKRHDYRFHCLESIR